MKVLSPARCLLTVSSMPKRNPRPQCRNFHASKCVRERRRPRFASIKASDMGLVSETRPTQEVLRPYNDMEKVALAERYTPEQLKAIEEGEEAISPEDLRQQGMFRLDPYRLPYLDDLSVLHPVADSKPKEESTIPRNAKWLNEQESFTEVSRWINEEHRSFTENASSSPIKDPSKLGVPGFKPSRLDFLKFMEESTSMTGGGKRGSNVIAPALPKIPSMKGQYQNKEEIDSRDPDGKWTRIHKVTGIPVDAILELKTKVLVRHNVVNQTRLGKIRSMYVLAIAGDTNGQLGIGEGKAIEVEDAMKKAMEAAIRNMQLIPRYEARTIFGETEGKVAACEVQLMARPPGFGLRCQHLIFEMARAAGIQDLAARVPRGRNKMNTVKAAYKALLSQRIPDEIARGRGMKLVDVRKVYYGGNQLLLRQDKVEEPAGEIV